MIILLVAFDRLRLGIANPPVAVDVIGAVQTAALRRVLYLDARRVAEVHTVLPIVLQLADTTPPNEIRQKRQAT